MTETNEMNDAKKEAGNSAGAEKSEQEKKPTKLEDVVPELYLEILTFRIFKGVLIYTGSVLAVLAAIAGFFGYEKLQDYNQSLTRTTSDLKDKMSETVTALNEQRNKIEKQLLELTAKKESLEQSIKESEIKSAQLDTSLTQSKTIQAGMMGLTGQMLQLPQEVGAKLTKVSMQQEAAENQSAQAQRLITDAVLTIEEMKSALAQEKVAQKKDYKDFTSKLDEQFQGLEDKTRNALDGLNKEVKESANWMIRENSTTRVFIRPDSEPGQTSAPPPISFYIHVKQVEDKINDGSALVIHRLSIFYEREGDLKCNINRVVTQGNAIRFYHPDGYLMTLLIRYGLDLNFANDYIGTQVRWKRVKDEEKAAAAAAGCAMVN